jgi:hypothetical protein
MLREKAGSHPAFDGPMILFHLSSIPGEPRVPDAVSIMMT